MAGGARPRAACPLKVGQRVLFSLHFVAEIALAAGRLHVAITLAVPEGVVVASWAPDWRKPSPGMLGFAREVLTAAGAAGPWAYVGDEEDDRLAAEKAGMAFIPAKRIRAPAR